jgi:hypothetical protein
LPGLPPFEPACASDALDVAITTSAARTAIPNGAMAFLIGLLLVNGRFSSGCKLHITSVEKSLPGAQTDALPDE